jgi:hypothetical protein
MADDGIDDLRRRVAHLEDEREIRYLLGRYGHHADLGHSDEWAGQWTEDGIYDLVTMKRDGAGYDGAVRFEGREALAAMIRDPAAHKRLEGRSLHLQDINLVIRIDGDEAFAHGYSITMLRDGEDIHIRTAGMVRWSFRRVEGRWRISGKNRRMVGDGTAFEDARTLSAFDAARPAT